MRQGLGEYIYMQSNYTKNGRDLKQRKGRRKRKAASHGEGDEE